MFAAWNVTSRCGQLSAVMEAAMATKITAALEDDL
jgi:hypothetical protein